MHGSREREYVVLRVRDNGPGLATELEERLYEPFAQGPQSLDRAQGGLGLGLAIVRHLVALHGGSVRAQSDGSGAEFIVRLPAYAREEAVASGTH